MTTPTPEEVAALAEWWRSVATDWNGERMVDGEPVRITPSAGQARKTADMLEALSRAEAAEAEKRAAYVAGTNSGYAAGVKAAARVLSASDNPSIQRMAGMISALKTEGKK